MYFSTVALVAPLALLWRRSSCAFGKNPQCRSRRVSLKLRQNREAESIEKRQTYYHTRIHNQLRNLVFVSKGSELAGGIGGMFG